MSSVQLNEFVSRYLPENPPQDPTDLRVSIFQFLAFARLGPRDIQFLDTESPHFIVSERGLAVLKDYERIKQETKATVTIQRAWRGYKSRSSHSSSGGEISSKTKKIQILKDHICILSDMYHEILSTTSRKVLFPLRIGVNLTFQDTQKEPSQAELEFMKLLNSEITFKASSNLSSVLKVSIRSLLVH